MYWLIVIGGIKAGREGLDAALEVGDDDEQGHGGQGQGDDGCTGLAVALYIEMDGIDDHEQAHEKYDVLRLPYFTDP